MCETEPNLTQNPEEVVAIDQEQGVTQEGGAVIPRLKNGMAVLAVYIELTQNDRDPNSISPWQRINFFSF